MFWRFGLQQPSNIRQLLDKPDLTIEELFEQDDLLQEVKGQNTLLLDHLAEPGVLLRLIDYVVSPEFEELSSRHTYLACEILSVDKPLFATVVVEHPELLDRLWSYMAGDRPLQFLQASYFSRVMCAFLQKEPVKILDYIKAQPDVVSQFLNHIETSAIIDLLLKLISLEEIPVGAGISEWLSSQNLVSRLVDLLDPHNDVDTHSMAGQVLIDIISISQCNNPDQPSIGTNCLVGELKSEAIVSRIMDYMLDPNAPNTTSTLVNGVFIFIELIRRNYSDNVVSPQANPNYSPTNVMVPVDLSDLMRAVSHRLGQFKELLLHPRHRSKVQAVGPNKAEPLGFERLRVGELFAELLHCSNMYKLNVAPEGTESASADGSNPSAAALADDTMSVSPPRDMPIDSVPSTTGDNVAIDSADGTPKDAAAALGASGISIPSNLDRVPVGQLLKWKMIEHSVVPMCLDLFFQFPWNNFLHSVVFDMLHQILNLPFALECNRALILTTFKDAKLTTRIAEAHRLNQAECEKPKGVRIGYMGHLTGIAEEVVRLFERCTSPLLEQLEEYMNDEAWREFVAALREARERDRLPLGGEKPTDNINMLARLQDSSYMESMNEDMDEDGPHDDDDDDDDDEDEEGYNGIRGGMGRMGGLGLLGGTGAGMEGDQFVRYLSHQITSELPEHLAGNSSDDENDVIDEGDDDDAEIGWINEYRKELTFDRNLPTTSNNTLMHPNSDNAMVLSDPDYSTGTATNPTLAKLGNEADVFNNRRSSLGTFENSSDDEADESFAAGSSSVSHAGEKRPAGSNNGATSSTGGPTTSGTKPDGLSTADATMVAASPSMAGTELLTVADWSADFLQAFETQSDGRSSPFKEVITEEGFDFQTDSGNGASRPSGSQQQAASTTAATGNDQSAAPTMMDQFEEDTEFSDFQQADTAPPPSASDASADPRPAAAFNTSADKS
ncbi:sporulation-induced protein [Dimargaris cristalligena]|nr:sporulation-induced protein [Dimargaris cristalligena]